MKAAPSVIVVFVIALIIAGVGGYWLGGNHASLFTGHGTVAADAQNPSAASAGEREVLYWYDPMFPQHRFDKPGKSPFMDMQLVPKYASSDAESGGVKIDSMLAQNLGVRTASVEKAKLNAVVDAVASVTFNERDLAVVQARTGGFVEHAHNLAPGDVISEGKAIVDILVPEWTAAQSEFLAIKNVGDESLTQAARDRLKLLGMPNSLIDRVHRTNQPHPVVTVTAPRGGVIQSLDVRPGMTVSPGMTLARINGLSTVWLEAAVPETQASAVVPGTPVEARLPAFPGEVFKGKIEAVLPEANADTRTVRVRAEFSNAKRRLKPGYFAQMRMVSGAAKETLVVPTEAVIRTGKRNVVIIAAADNRFQPVEVDIGAEVDGRTAVLRGLSEGQKVVVSGQFLIDSEASLRGAIERMQPVPSNVATEIARHEGEGKITALSKEAVTLSHGPIPSIQWGPMVMDFQLAKPELAKGLKVGDTVTFRFHQTDDGDVIVEHIEKRGGSK